MQEQQQETGAHPLDQYAVWTDEVAKYPPTAEPFYLALGIADECGELEDAACEKDSVEVMAECGDVMWYSARYSTRVLGLPFSALVFAAEQISRLWKINIIEAVGAICGVEKKRIRDGELWDDAKREEKNHAAADALVKVIAWALATTRESNPAAAPIDIVTINRAKLSARLESGTIRGDGGNR